jgi:hypothetical protein
MPLYYYIIGFCAVFYLIYTWSYIGVFRKTAPVYMSGTLIRFHLIMIWLIPFFWIVLLKTALKPSRRYKNHPQLNSDSPEPVSDSWFVSTQTFLHGSVLTRHENDSWTGSYHDTFGTDSVGDVDYTGGDTGDSL